MIILINAMFAEVNRAEVLLVCIHLLSDSTQRRRGIPFRESRLRTNGRLLKELLYRLLRLSMSVEADSVVRNLGVFQWCRYLLKVNVFDAIRLVRWQR